MDEEDRKKLMEFQIEVKFYFKKKITNKKSL